ncbi:MAG: hypothetical protein F4Z21_15675 [Acidobacteria bacterium]|nr:hypothetical protein [Acidobacteriota bacterium]
MKLLETRAVDAIRDLIGHVPGVEIDSVEHESKVGRAFRVDGLIGLSYFGERYVLVVEVKSNGAPRFVRAGVYQLESRVARMRRSAEASDGRCLIPMLVSPYLSPQSRAICTDHDVAYLDLIGNARLTFDTVYIERAVADKPSTETRALRSIFRPKAAAVLRVLLRDPDRTWRVADLAAQAHASYGHVSNVRKALLEREWLEVRDDGAALLRPEALLQTWRESYRHPPGRFITGYTHLHGRELDERLRGKLNPYPELPRAIYSLHSAAQWFAPFGRSGTHTFYTDEPGARMLKEELKLTPAAAGANVMLQVTTDESLFDDASEPVPKLFCTSPVVTYLDLWNGNDRDREAAEHLAGEFFQWLK